MEVLHKSIDCLDKWMRENGTNPVLRKFLVEYANGGGGKTMQEIVGCRREYRRLAVSVDCIGWRRLMEGMISKELVELQKYALVESPSKLTVDQWSKELVIRLLEITHGQWLYRNVMDLVTRRKEEIRREMEEQLVLGEEGLDEEDAFLLEINLDELDSSSREDQEYWLLALRAAREARHLRMQQQADSLEESRVRAAFTSSCSAGTKVE